MKEQVTFIVNPFSGTTNKENFEKIIQENIDTIRYDYSIKFTQSAGHATTLAKEAVAQNKSLVVAVGGDGTINEVAGGLVHSDTALAIIPAGSGNGFALHLGMSKDFKTAIQQLNKAKKAKVDTCLLNGQFFINVAGLGFDAQVAYHTKTDTKRLNDGLLDIILFKDTFVPRYFLEAYRFVNNTVHKSSITETYTGKSIKITSVNKSYYHLDGEGFDKTTDFEISVVPDSIWVMQIK